MLNDTRAIMTARQAHAEIRRRLAGESWFGGAIPTPDDDGATGFIIIAADVEAGRAWEKDNRGAFAGYSLFVRKAVG